MYTLSYVTSLALAFNGVTDRLKHRKSTVVDLKAQVLSLVDRAKVKDEAISSLADDVLERDDTIFELRERNGKLASDVDFIQNKIEKIEENEAQATEERCVQNEEAKKKARIAGAFWFKDNTLKRHPEAAQFLKWFESSDKEDESLDDGVESSDDEDQYGNNICSRISFIFHFFLGPA